MARKQKVTFYAEDEFDRLLQKVMDDNNLKPADVVEIMNNRVGERTIYKYTGGEVMPAVWFWQRLYEVTHDYRLTTLITGPVDVMTVPLPVLGVGDTASIKHLIRTTKTHTDVISALADIFEDGKVDKKDRKAVGDLAKAIPEAIRVLAQVKHAVEAAYEKANY